MMLARVSSMLTTLLSRSRRERCMGRGCGVPGGIRTPNLLIRSQKLYPVELQAQVECWSDGVLECWRGIIIHHSITPALQQKIGVANGTRTRNNQNHNLGLYH